MPALQHPSTKCRSRVEAHEWKHSHLILSEMQLFVLIGIKHYDTAIIIIDHDAVDYAAIGLTLLFIVNTYGVLSYWWDR